MNNSTVEPKPTQTTDVTTTTKPSLLDAVLDMPVPKCIVKQTYCAYCGACPPKDECFSGRWIMSKEVEG